VGFKRSKATEESEDLKNSLKTSNLENPNRWVLVVNYVPFENERERERSYDLWVRSFFHQKK
jgi:hypothetical protein